ncbi:MAG: hypothetical protein DRJ01_10485 [Bacteroidetes bacterium]|nr:MAG: hypothetical protein DRJ01_10485 [Bacteroidota bacterium]
MKKLLVIALTIFMSFTFTTVFCQDPPPPPSGGHSQNGNQNGGNAPLGEGLFTLLTLGIMYGGIKLKSHQKNISNKKKQNDY